MADLFLDRTLPNDTGAERAIIGAVIIDGRLYADVEPRLKLTDFYLDSHRIVWRAMGTLHAANRPIDLVTLIAELKRAGDLEAAGGAARVCEFDRTMPRIENADYYVDIVLGKAQARALISAAHAMLSAAFDGEMSTGELLERSERAVMRVGERATDRSLEPIVNAAHEWVEYVEGVQAGTIAPGVRTGIPTFDLMTGGLQRANLIVLAARPKVGKTSFALQIAQYAALNGTPVAFFSLEMSRRELAARYICDAAKVDGHKAKVGRLTPEEMRLIASAAVDTTDLPLYIDDAAGATVPEIRAKVRRLKRDLGERGKGLLVVVDYLQLLRSRERRENRTQEVTAITRELKLTAKDEDVPLVALSQLSRASEQRAGHRPQLSDLRESGSIEQDSDLVAFLHADPERMHETHRPTELILEAHRAGPTGVVALTFFREFTRFEEVYEPYV